MTAPRPPGQELLGLLDDYDPAIAALALGARELVLLEAPEANEFIYDGAYTVAVHFTPTGRWQDAFCHITAHTKHVNLGFNRGTELPDPKNKLKGTGNLIRHLSVSALEDLDNPDLRAFLRAALKHANWTKVVRANSEEMGRTIVQRFTGPKRRPRRREK
jgi:Domain of unknown function (DU1801)